MGKKILIIDNDRTSTRLLEYMLKQGGYQALVAQNGLDGIKKAQDEAPDLVVLDIVLPGMDGFEVCHRLRVEDKTSQLPIMILSGRAHETDIATGFKMGADEYITKPATPSEIVNKIEMLLAGRTVVNSKIAAFLSPQRKIGTTTTVVNVAIALSQMGKRVIAVDMYPYDGSISQQLGIKPQDNSFIPELLINNFEPGYFESALVAHESGVKVLRAFEASVEPEKMSANKIDLLFNKLNEATDYFLVDLPFQPTIPTRMVLVRCDLSIIVSDHSMEALAGIKSVVTILHFLGNYSEQINVVAVDSKGTFPDMALATIGHYVQANLGVTLLGIIPYDDKCSTELSNDSVPLQISRPDCPVAHSQRELAQQIMAKAQAEKYTPRVMVERT